MKVTVKMPTEVEVKYVRLRLPVKYEEEDMPNDFPFRHNDMWSVTIDIDTGKISPWPKGADKRGVEKRLFMKVVDGGSYYLLDADMRVVASLISEYVPHSVIPGKYGDYVDLDIKSDGTIANWDVDADEMAREFWRDD